MIIIFCIVLIKYLKDAYYITLLWYLLAFYLYIITRILMHFNFIVCLFLALVNMELYSYYYMYNYIYEYLCYPEVYEISFTELLASNSSDVLLNIDSNNSIYLAKVDSKILVPYNSPIISTVKGDYQLGCLKRRPLPIYPFCSIQFSNIRTELVISFMKTNNNIKVDMNYSNEIIREVENNNNFFYEKENEFKKLATQEMQKIINSLPNKERREAIIALTSNIENLIKCENIISFINEEIKKNMKTIKNNVAFITNFNNHLCLFKRVDGIVYINIFSHLKSIFPEYIYSTNLVNPVSEDLNSILNDKYPIFNNRLNIEYLDNLDFSGEKKHQYIIGEYAINESYVEFQMDSNNTSIKYGYDYIEKENIRILLDKHLAINKVLKVEDFIKDTVLDYLKTNVI